MSVSLVSMWLLLKAKQLVMSGHLSLSTSHQYVALAMSCASLAQVSSVATVGAKGGSLIRLICFSTYSTKIVWVV